MTTREILNSHPVSNLKKEIGKVRKDLKVSGKKKAEIVDMMLKFKADFSYITMYEKPKRAPPKKKEAPKKKIVKKAKPMIPKINISEVKDKVEPKKPEPKSQLGKIKEKPVRIRVAPKKEAPKKKRILKKKKVEEKKPAPKEAPKKKEEPKKKGKKSKEQQVKDFIEKFVDTLQSVNKSNLKKKLDQLLKERQAVKDVDEVPSEAEVRDMVTNASMRG